ncbi:DMT family transporter [Acetobacter sp. TBRC 12305]|uniref:DMT family transporter n=1 Tax=Acetobacter garciniae TaxID=2817435 RepID=A0A939HIG1_9PROT|nr:DMT family transporter [Acetobacter garciniae]MBO1324995.1 DMT family transporter [Acetobacter garciniae]MBX0344686.1 DMT family transporter [Acetobacter garciniae]
MAFSFPPVLRGLVYAAIAIGVWSGSLVMLRFGVTTGLNAYDLTALRFGTAALILAPVVIRRGFAFGQLGPAGVLGMVLGFGAPYVLLISLALETASASAAGSLNPGVMAIVSLILGAVVFGDRIGPLAVAGAALVLAGACLFAGLAEKLAIGHLILIGTGIMWAAYAVVVRRYGISALHATAIVAVGSAIVYLPVYVMALPKRIPGAPAFDLLMQAGFQGVLVSVLAVFAFNRSAELLGPIAGATLPALVPLVTLMIGALTLHEQAGGAEYFSAVLVGLGVAGVLVSRVLARGRPKTVPDRCGAATP